MLISKSVFVGHDVVGDEQFHDFREMTMRAGDITSRDRDGGSHHLVL